jgi:hypothetical protein
MSEAVQQEKKEPCGLCGSVDVLEVSHLTPRFVAKRMRTDSPTGFFRAGRNVNKRLQDAPKRRMLCRACENSLSDLETRFAQYAFSPIMDGAVVELEMSETHHRFCASMVWRNLKRILLDRDDLKDDYSADDWQAIERAEVGLRDYLLGTGPAPSDVEFHLFNARTTTDAEIPGINAFCNLSMGALLLGRDQAPERLYSISPMNGLILVGLVHSDAKCREEWATGMTAVLPGQPWRNHDQAIHDVYFGGILLKLAEEQLAAFEAMSAKQKAVVEESMKAADPEKWAKSPHGSAVIQDYLNDLRRGKN